MVLTSDQPYHPTRQRNDESSMTEPNSLVLMLLDDIVATVKQTSVLGEILAPGGEDLLDVEANEQELTLADLTCISRLGVRSDRRLDRPKEWNGEASGFDDFVFKFANWLSLLPGDTERLWRNLCTWVGRSCAQRLATALRALDGATAFRCIRHHPEKQSAFETRPALPKGVQT